MEWSCYTEVGEHERPESSDQGKPLASFPMSLRMRQGKPPFGNSGPIGLSHRWWR